MNFESGKGPASRQTWVAVLLSCFGSGIGHVYAGQATKGLVLFGLELLPVPLIFALAFLPASSGVLYVLLGLIAFAVGLFVFAIGSAARAASRAPASFRRGPFQQAGIYALLAFVSLGWSVGGTFLIREHAFEAFLVPTQSMDPAVRDGDRILVSKIGLDALEAGDIVVFRSPENPRQHWIKRIHAIGGEEVPGGTLGRDWLYVLGDNLDNSKDSRHFGYIPVASVVGVVKYVFWSKDGPRTLDAPR